MCRRTALHLALKRGHTETAVALLKAGADVNCKDNNGYGSWASSLCGCVAHFTGAGRSVHSALELQGRLRWSCRDTALHYASEWGNTETAMALVKAGADVHCKRFYGYGSWA